MNLLLRSYTLLCFGVFCSLGCSDDGSKGNAGTGGAGGDITEHVYNYDDPNIVYSGRIQLTEGKAPRFTAPAVTISARFKGTGASMKISDGASTANYFDAIVDDDYENATKVKGDDSGIAILASGLPYGEHEVSVVKRTEANTGSSTSRASHSPARSCRLPPL